MTIVESGAQRLERVHSLRWRRSPGAGQDLESQLEGDHRRGELDEDNFPSMINLMGIVFRRFRGMFRVCRPIISAIVGLILISIAIPAQVAWKDKVNVTVFVKVDSKSKELRSTSCRRIRRSASSRSCACCLPPVDRRYLTRRRAPKPLRDSSSVSFALAKG